MSKFNDVELITLDNLKDYDELIKKFISDKNLGNIQSVSVDPENHKINFYKADTTVPAYSVDLSGIDDSISALEDLIGTVPSNKTVISLIKDAQDKADANEKSIEAINDGTSGIYQKTKDYTDSLVGAIPLVRNDESGEAIPVAETVVDYITSVKNDASATKGKVDTLIGTDSSKSIRTIANEELASQLLSGKADADFKTLKQLASWIEDHPEEVADINLSIQNLESLIGVIPSDATDSENIVKYIQSLVNTEKLRADGVESDIDTRLQAVEETLGEGRDVDERINDAIDALDYTYEGVEADIVTDVSQTDGKISVTKTSISFATDSQIEALFKNEDVTT